MKLENQVVSLDLAKRLKELGVKQESLFYWDRNGNLYIRIEREVGFMLRLSDETHHDGTTVGDFFSAFTVAELGEMLPEFTFMPTHPTECESCEQEIKPDKDVACVYFRANRSGKKFVVSYYTSGRNIAGKTEWADTEADARAKMLIYLLENELI